MTWESELCMLLHIDMRFVRELLPEVFYIFSFRTLSAEKVVVRIIIIKGPLRYRPTMRRGSEVKNRV